MNIPNYCSNPPTIQNYETRNTETILYEPINYATGCDVLQYFRVAKQVVNSTYIVPSQNDIEDVPSIPSIMNENIF